MINENCFGNVQLTVAFVSGFLKEGETLDPFSRKTTLIFALFQLIYVVLCLVPVPLFYSNQVFNEVFILVLVLVGIWNGGSYYIQIFSQRYNEKFEKGSNFKYE